MAKTGIQVRMRRNNYKIAAVAIFFVAAGFLLFRGGNDIWGVLGSIPPPIDTRKTIDTSTYYIVRQTHEPLFRADDLQNYSSKILKNWSRTADYREFLFFPKLNLRFGPHEALTPSSFYDYIGSITEKYGVPFRAERLESGVKVIFDLPQKRYLYFLTWYENAPSLRKDNFEFGLGEFYPVLHDKSRVVLKRKARIANGYNTIVFHAYNGGEDINLENRDMQDFNLLSSFQQPSWIKEEYAGIKFPDPRTIVLLINHPDEKVRRSLYGCLDVEGVRKALVPQRSEFYDVKTVLPMGIPGAKSGLPEQVCKKIGTPPDRPLIFVNQLQGNDSTLREYLRGFTERSGLPIAVRRFSYQELSSLLKAPDRPKFAYNVLLMILDTFRPDHKVFFEYTSGTKSFLDFSVPETERLFGRLLIAEDPEAQSEVAGALAGSLSERALALPLYQTYSTLYYPKYIKNVSVGNSFSQYPEIAEFRR